jgi:hypothetical protein
MATVAAHRAARRNRDHVSLIRGVVRLLPTNRQSPKETSETVFGLPDRPPSTFLSPKWRKLIFANGKADRRPYETAVLATLRDRLKGSGIWVAGSRDYRAFEDYLLPAVAVRDTGIGGETDLAPCRPARTCPRRDHPR